ncbi:MAG: hypothetical protein ACNS60_02575 [Candidatus Cyclobacteriaceae bacterium M2_1C_046]
MRSFLLAIVVIIFSSCGQQELSEEQRKEINKELKNRKPVKIQEAELLSKAMEIAQNSWKDTAKSDYSWKIYSQEPNDPVLNSLWSAYTYSFEQGTIPGDNVQLGDTVIYYSRPLYQDKNFYGMAALLIPKKDIVLQIVQEDQ